jgi:predicted lipoprotein with Yx(FWY)xxD motif
VIKTLPAVSALAVAAALAAAGCGGSSSSGESGAYGSGENAGSTQAASGESSGRYGGGSSSSATSGSGAVSVATVGDVGKVLVDAEGLTLYYFEKDKGGKSACYGACASAWPPLTTGGAPHAMSGAKSSKLGTTARKDGTTQVTYAGWPLYTYAADTKPGEDNGTDVNSFGASWYPLHPDGEKAGS